MKLLDTHVHVQWRDPATFPDWIPQTDAGVFQPVINYSVGYLLPGTDAKTIRLAMTQNGEGDCCDVLVIPRALIIKIRKVRGKP